SAARRAGQWQRGPDASSISLPPAASRQAPPALHQGSVRPVAPGGLLDAELVPFRILERDANVIPELARPELFGPKTEEPLHLGIAAVWSDVQIEVDPVLCGLPLRHPL